MSHSTVLVLCFRKLKVLVNYYIPASISLYISFFMKKVFYIYTYSYRFIKCKENDRKRTLRNMTECSNGSYEDGLNLMEIL